MQILVDWFHQRMQSRHRVAYMLPMYYLQRGRIAEALHAYTTVKDCFQGSQGMQWCSSAYNPLCTFDLVTYYCCVGCCCGTSTLEWGIIRTDRAVAGQNWLYSGHGACICFATLMQAMIVIIFIDMVPSSASMQSYSYLALLAHQTRHSAATAITTAAACLCITLL